jgi:pre-mRNA-splicing factor CDC5/CEF1
MRILIKGGVWKNTEDEILKAAVMKYGKNQWARVASLLNRKSAKQCKARWYEWLDPSIKKTEWSREEEEKLLHLAKLMPNQWRTIAPIVGRPAGQCMEHYEKLLDQAQDDKSEEMAVDDPRRLRPGEIDPTPETKPARPDPIDMDEDEKEMLSEARARLANTKGKKAKRKVRERMLEESRRLAMLQKRRELKAAGIESRLTLGGKRKYMDYAREIPFQKVPQPGFYDVTEENEEASKLALDPKAFGVELQKLEGKSAKEEEERQRKKDQKLMNNLFKENAPAAILKISQEVDPVALRRRAPLELPAPQVSESELEDIVKLGKNSLLAQSEGGVAATQALLGDYSQAFKPTPTPMRTPQHEDIIMQEAKNLRALREMTPLTQQELPELYEGTGFDGAAPRKANFATPNTVISSIQATPSRGAVPGTPMSVASSYAKGSNKLVRDQLGLNSASTMMGDDSFSVSEMSGIVSRSDRERNKALQKSLLSKLKALPEPEYTYEVALPADLAAEEEEDLHAMAGKPEDAAEVEVRRQKRREEAHRREMARRSEVLKRGLPRPAYISESLAKPSLSKDHYPAEMVSASALVNQEMLNLLHYEDQKYPFEMSAAKRARISIDDFEIIEATDLHAAADLIEKEMKAIDGGDNAGEEEKFTAFVDQIMNSNENKFFVPNDQVEGGGLLKVPGNKTEYLLALKSQFKAIQSRFEKDRKKASKMEHKQNVLTQGYASRGVALRKSIDENHKSFGQAALDLDCLQYLRDQEMKVATQRLERLKKEATEAETVERTLQTQYADLVRFARASGISM